MSRTIVVIDTETTGLRPYDRVVTLAALRWVEGSGDYTLRHLCFDPRKDSDPGALAIHGWDDWTTRFQDLFSEHAADLHTWLSAADLIVAHNAKFDLHYVQREFRKAGQPALAVPSFCTMDTARERWRGSAGLDACIERLGLARRPGRHQASEDAFLTWNLFRHYHGQPAIPLPATWAAPDNFRTPEPRPEGPLPRRAIKRARDGSWTRDQRDSVAEIAAPIATVLASVAASDEVVDAAERAVLASVVETAATRIGAPANETETAGVIDALVERPVSGNRLTRALKSVLADDVWRKELPRLIATIATTESAVSEGKRAALARLRDTIRRIRGD